MAIAPISSVSFRNNASVNFGSKHENDTEGQEFQPTKRQGTTDLSKMPVVVLLAMTPAISEAKELNLPETDNTLPVEITENKIPETDAMTFVLTPKTQEMQQSRAPYGWESLNHENINYVYKFNSKGKQYNLIFSANGTKNDAQSVYIIPQDTKGSNKISDTPPEVRQLIYHNLGENEFCGAVIDEDIRDKNTGRYKGTFRSEMRLPDEVAQKIIDLVTNHSNFINNTQIKIKEVDYPNLLPPKLYE